LFPYSFVRTVAAVAGVFTCNMNDLVDFAAAKLLVKTPTKAENTNKG